MYIGITNLKLSNWGDIVYRNSNSEFLISCFVFPSGWPFRPLGSFNPVSPGVLSLKRSTSHRFCEIGRWISQRHTVKHLIRHHLHHSVTISSHLHCLVTCTDLCLRVGQPDVSPLADSGTERGEPLT